MNWILKFDSWISVLISYVESQIPYLLTNAIDTHLNFMFCGFSGFEPTVYTP